MGKNKIEIKKVTIDHMKILGGNYGLNYDLSEKGVISNVVLKQYDNSGWRESMRINVKQAKEIIDVLQEFLKNVGHDI